MTMTRRNLDQLRSFVDALIMIAIRSMQCPRDMRNELTRSIAVHDVWSWNDISAPLITKGLELLEQELRIESSYSPANQSILMNFNLMTVVFNQRQAELFRQKLLSFYPVQPVEEVSDDRQN